MTEADELLAGGIITAGDYKRIALYEAVKLFSIHWEIRTVLYAGILLLTSGVGILVYLNIDTIGHVTILATIALVIIACFYYLMKHKQPYSTGVVKNVSPLFDYIALFGCLLFGTFIGYLQFAYHPFGTHIIWMATLLPAACSLYCAYAFDHKGLLALGITGIAGTLGLSVAPTQVLYNNNFTDVTFLFTALAFGFLLLAVAAYSSQKKSKLHFNFTYHHFAITVLFVACLLLLFNYPYKVFSFLLLAALCFYFVRYAIAKQSFLFLLYSCLYTYIGLTYVVFSFLLKGNYSEGAFMLSVLYIVLSCVGVIRFFIDYKKILRLS